MLLSERRSGAVRVRASPDALGPQQPHRPAETRNVMEPNRPTAMAHGNDTAVRTTGDVFPGLDAQSQAGPGRRDRAAVDAFDTEQPVRARAPPAVGTRHTVIHVSQAGTASPVPPWKGKIRQSASFERLALFWKLFALILLLCSGYDPANPVVPRACMSAWWWRARFRGDRGMLPISTSVRILLLLLSFPAHAS